MTPDEKLAFYEQHIATQAKVLCDLENENAQLKTALAALIAQVEEIDKAIKDNSPSGSLSS